LSGSFLAPILLLLAQVGDTTVEVELVSDGSGAGRGGKAQADALPPLMPGLPARRQN